MSVHSAKTARFLFPFCLFMIAAGWFQISTVAAQSLYKLPVLNPQQKVALVIGNDDYLAARSLKNAKNDAKLIGDTLRGLGFRVIDRYDLPQRGMEAAFREFSAALGVGGGGGGASSSSNSVAFFFYAGHGLQVGGKNYLVPVDYELRKGVGGLWEIGAALDGIAGKSRMNIIVLDACRNTSEDIYKALNGQPGFTEFKNTPDGTFVAFSTSPGKIASDGGAGRNSPYTTILAEALRWKPAPLEQVFMYTQLRVEEATGGQQVPWRNSSTKSLFFFSPDETALKPSPLAGSSAAASTLNNLPPALSRSLTGRLQSFEFSAPFVNERGTTLGQKPGRARRFVENVKNLALEMVEINGGRFLMGGAEAEITNALTLAKQFDEFDEETYRVLTAELPRRAVNVKGFFMSRAEITQAQYQAVMGRLPSIEPQFRGPRMPVFNVTWTEANEFCARLSSLTGRLYRLPTEAEWEYAARAGTETPFAFGETLNLQSAVYNWALPYGKAAHGTRPNGPRETGALNSTNAFGLQDMHGNVWEWCADYWHSDYDGAPTDGGSWDEPQAIESDDPDEDEAVDTTRVVRGGSWFSPAARCRSASRYHYSPATRSNTIGFRVVLQ